MFNIEMKVIMNEGRGQSSSVEGRDGWSEFEGSDDSEAIEIKVS